MTSAGDEVPALGELNVETAQIGLQPRVLNWDEMRGLVSLVEVRVPHSRGGGEGTAGLPVHSDRVDDVAALIETSSLDAGQSGADDGNRTRVFGLGSRFGASRAAFGCPRSRVTCRLASMCVGDCALASPLLVTAS